MIYFYVFVLYLCLRKNFIFTFSLIMTKVQSKRRALFPLVFTSKFIITHKKNNKTKQIKQTNAQMSQIKTLFTLSLGMVLVCSYILVNLSLKPWKSL